MRLAARHACELSLDTAKRSYLTQRCPFDLRSRQVALGSGVMATAAAVQIGRSRGQAPPRFFEPCAIAYAERIRGSDRWISES
jgi:hypothetical protein